MAGLYFAHNGLLHIVAYLGLGVVEVLLGEDRLAVVLDRAVLAVAPLSGVKRRSAAVTLVGPHDFFSFP